jgi:hypothetical protein
VLRAYDNRASSVTVRRPDVYLNWPKLSGTTRIVFDSSVGDSGGKDFGEALPGGGTEEWMWERDLSKYKSRLLVISTPFLEGTHFAELIQQFVPLVEQLRDLHRDGYVHGDIRARNVAFAEGHGSSLFDWDLGGLEGTVVYPRGYNNVLTDGYRRNKPGGLITRSDDWFAFSRLTFAVHEIEPPPILPNAGIEILRARNELHSRHRELRGAPAELNDNNIESRADELIDFFRKATESGWSVTPDDLHRLDLELHERKATGSPSKHVAQGENQVEIMPAQSS